MLRKTMEDTNRSELAQAIQQRLDGLTKPQGSLGELEALASRYCAIRGELLPSMPRKAMYLFCADHGVVLEGVSAYPQEVTRQMVANFQRGGAAINVLCRRFGIEPVIVDAGVASGAIAGVVDRKISRGTKNFARERAMTREQAELAVGHGEELATKCTADLVGIGEMGIGNTTSAAAIVSALTGLDPEETTGRGTGVDEEGWKRKVDVIRAALEKHQPRREDALDVLSAVGGFEIAMMAGFLIGCARRRVPVVVDGFIASTAALVAQSLDGEALSTAFFSHRSAEAGANALAGALQVEPLLDLGMRLGEGTGAALMMNLIETSLCLYREMATFEEAAVATALEKAGLQS
jgi:nicotinate-nucleotide--dimethylbenzimidazole phosphoribosyltransferase